MEVCGGGGGGIMGKDLKYNLIVVSHFKGVIKYKYSSVRDFFVISVDNSSPSK